MFFKVDGMEFSYKSEKVLEDISFEIERKEMVALLGPNGVGKTTLMKCINRILKPSCGSVLLEGLDLTDTDRRTISRNVGYVSQRGETSRLTVFDSILLGRRPHIEWDATEKDISITSRVIHLMELDHLSLKYVDEISGGEYQLVQIARAIVQQPRVILLDEPTSNLDLSNQHMIMHMVSNLVSCNDMAAVMTIHDLNLAIRHSDKFILMKDGRIFAAGDKGIITPENIKRVYNIDAYVDEIRGYPRVMPI
ncbi:MAG: ABC transporter ATP-binding protein [Candidatus Methanogranum gryphiswaldense]|nr:MAG: ABC transporter ATP-binding protein [Candidatus Methanogranum sp. U3.2.1]